MTPSTTNANQVRQAEQQLESRLRDGNGNTKDNAAWGPSFRTASAINSHERGIVIDRIGVSPSFIRETLATARTYAGMGYSTFYDGSTGTKLAQLLGSPVPQTGTSGGAVFSEEDVVAAEAALEEAGEKIGVDEDLEGSDRGSAGDRSSTDSTTPTTSSGSS